MKTQSQAVKRPAAHSRLKRLRELSERLHGGLPNFMTQADLGKMRADKEWEVIRQTPH